MSDINYSQASELSQDLLKYADTLTNADKIRLAAYVISLANAIQQEADIGFDAMEAACADTDLFNDIDKDDEMDPGYHLHRLLEDLSDDLEGLAEYIA